MLLHVYSETRIHALERVGDRTMVKLAALLCSLITVGGGDSVFF